MSRKLITKTFTKFFKYKETKTNYDDEEIKVDDVIIYVGEEPNFKEFYAHSKTLCNKSDYFNKILSNKDIEKQDEKCIIKEPNVTPKVFEFIIKYLSSEHFNVNDETGIEILNIMVASEDLKLNQLIKLAEDSFIKNHKQFLQIDPVEILQIVCCRQIFNNIQKFCLETICLEPKMLFNSVKFINLPAPLLEIILKRDKINLDEIEVWENLIKWGLAQEISLNEDVSKWRQEEFNDFKRILYKLIPLIKFCDISSVDYFNKVRPYEEILSKELREEILKYHMVPGYISTFDNLLPRLPKFYDDSVLINQRHFTIFANWIDRKMKNGKYFKAASYKFNLLYRASKDGDTAAAFHQKCDDKGATIVIAKITNSEQIVGGYNPLCWDSSNKYKSTNDSFIFSFTNRSNFQTAKVSYSNGNRYSIGCYSDIGPSFSGVHHLYFYNGHLYNNYNRSYSSYPKIDSIHSGNFNDYEVFKVTRT